MNALAWIRRVFGKYVDLAILVFFIFYVVGLALPNLSTNWFSLTMGFAIVIMFLGQVFLMTAFGQTYFFYFYSCFSGVSLSVLFWMASNVPYSDYAYPLYAVILVVLIGVPLVVHLKTRKRLGTIPMIPTYSIFFLGLLIVLSTSGVASSSLTNTSLSNLFFLAVVVFVINSILGLNIAYRTLMLNRYLKINNRNSYLVKIKDDLMAKYTDKDAQGDVDLITYYLSSSLESFVYGDFDRSYMNAFKIIDNRGTVFKRIYTLSIEESHWIKLRDIRNNLSHAKISSSNKKEREQMQEEKQTEALKNLKKDLFQETLNVLKLVKFEFIDKALEKEKPNYASTS